MSMGKNIAIFRKIKGLTQEALGQVLGVTNQAVSKWESEVSMPDVMLLPRIANALDITLDDLFAEQTVQVSRARPNALNMEAVRNFPKVAQGIVMDAMLNQTNLTNCSSWEFLKPKVTSSTPKHDGIKPIYTMCCLSDTAGAAFVSNTLTVIDAETSPTDIGSVFEKPEVASGVKKLADPNVRRVLSHVCNEYFQRSAPFNCNDPEYFTVDLRPDELARSLEISVDDVLEAVEKLISLNVVELETNQGTRYLLHKVKAIEAAVSFRLIERLIHNEVGFGCGEFLALTRH